MKKINYLACYWCLAPAFLGVPMMEIIQIIRRYNPMQPMLQGRPIADAAFEQALVDLDIDDVVDGSVLTGRSRNGDLPGAE